MCLKFFANLGGQLINLFQQWHLRGPGSFRDSCAYNPKKTGKKILTKEEKVTKFKINTWAADLFIHISTCVNSDTRSLNSFGSETTSFCMILNVMCLKPSRSHALEIAYFLHSFYIWRIFLILPTAQASKHPGWAIGPWLIWTVEGAVLVLVSYSFGYSFENRTTS